MNAYRRIEANEAFDLIEEKTLVGNNQLKRIRPNIYRTFLKVKNPDSIQKVDKIANASRLNFLFLAKTFIFFLIYFQGRTIKQGLFNIEWIPNILPKSQYGELRIQIQFGHMKNDTVIVKE